MKLTFAQRRLLKRLIATPGSAVSITTHDTVDYMRGPRFSGRFHFAPCPTCHHAHSEPTHWKVIFALVEGGYLKERCRGASWYFAADIPAHVIADLAPAAQSEQAA